MKVRHEPSALAVSDIKQEATPAGGIFHVRTHQNMKLGSLRIAIRSNEPQFGELRYFPEGVRLAEKAPVHRIINCCNLSLDGPWSAQALEQARDRNYRAGRFAGGYYVTDHFGPPAYLVTRGHELWIFAQRFEPILWPFVVKFLLTVHAVDESLLHLKAAGVALGSSGTLLVGRGGSGKTVLVARLCQSGAHFLTNTHALIRDRTLLAVPTAMRVRNDPLFGETIASGRLTAGIKPGEYVADPLVDLKWPSVDAVPLRNICLIDYRGPKRSIIREVAADTLFNYMEHFSLAVNIYGIREDVFDYLGGDVQRFSDKWNETKAQLRELINRCRGYYVSCDVMDDENLRALRETLTS
jgi:hypothetical protein